MRRTIILLALLATCAPQEPIYKPVEVPMPVVTPCQPISLPPQTTLKIDPQASLFIKVQALLEKLTSDQALLKQIACRHP